MIRSLTQAERALIQQELGDAVRLDEVRLVAMPWPLYRAFVPGRAFGRSWICWPGRGLPADFAVAPLSLQATLIHEMVHVWQAQTGVNLLTGKLRAGDGPRAYAYPDGLCGWDALNIEQQAMTVEHRFRARRGQGVPKGHAHFAAVCPLRTEKPG